MKAIRSLLFVSLVSVTYLIGCSDNTFSIKPSQACLSFNQVHGQGACEFGESGISTFSYPVTTGKADILFVNDSSGSMYPEQVKMADRFPDFMQSINYLDINVAMITTDISHNKFVTFSGGKKYLSSKEDSLASMDAQFKDAIQMDDCDILGVNCGSGDERGIYALNQAFNNHAQNSNFFRAGAHLAVVILSDEDERSNGGKFDAFPLEPMDRPESLVSNLVSNFGPDKVMSVHSVIVRPIDYVNRPHDAYTDQQCFYTQNSQTRWDGSSVKAFYGTQYYALSNPSGALAGSKNIQQGVSGSICANDYGKALGDIAAQLKGIDSILLPCEPLNGELKVTVESSGQELDFTLEGKTVRFNSTVAAGVVVRPQFQCARML